MDKLITSRNLVESDLGPLRRFTGILDSIPTEAKKPYQPADGSEPKRPAKAQTQAVLNMKEIEVIEAIEAYHLPIWVSRPFTISNRTKSRWGVIMDSFNNLVDPILYTKEQLTSHLEDGTPNPVYVPPSKRMDVTDCYGKRIGLVLSDGEEGRPMPVPLFDGRANEGKGGDVPTATWMIYMVEGIGVIGTSAQSPLDLAMGILNGKTASEFSKAVLAEESIRSDSQLMTALSQIGRAHV